MDIGLEAASGAVFRNSFAFKAKLNAVEMKVIGNESNKYHLLVCAGS